MGIGAAVDAGTQTLKTAFQRMKEVVDDGGKAVKQLASNDGFGLLQTGVEAAAQGLEAIPIAGGVASAALKALAAPVTLVKTAMDAFAGRGAGRLRRADRPGRGDGRLPEPARRPPGGAADGGIATRG